MRNCGRCGHHNADHLTYCSACGRRLPETDRVPLMPEARPPTSAGDGVGHDATQRDPHPAFAATLATAHVHRARAESGRSPGDIGLFTKGTDATRYVFGYVRGRMVAESRRRRLIEERDGARRLVEGALVELGQIVLTDGTGTPELAGLVDEIVRARARREGATTDLAAAEKFRTVEDLRLGMQEAAGEAECKACETGAAGVDGMLRQLGDQQNQVDTALDRLGDNEADGGRPNTERAALDARRAHLNEQVAALRERGAALRASTMAARAKWDQAVAARRQAAAAMAASIAGHARDRAESEQHMRVLTTQVGQTALRLRLPLGPLLPSYARIDRLEQTIADLDREIAGAERAIGLTDFPKLATGLGVLTGILGVLGMGLWALLH